jgi:hypothetical protein
MSMSPDVRQKLLVATRGAAEAFIEDLSYFRGIVSKRNIQRQDVRRMSNELRRILIDNGGDLEKIAAPRIGKVMLQMPDNGPYHRASWASPMTFFGSGGVDLFGIGSVRAAAAFRSAKHPPIPGFHPDKTTEATVDQFMSQGVLCRNGTWVSRRDTIKYVANVSHGVHSGTAKEESEKLLQDIRSAIIYRPPTKQSPLMLMNVPHMLSAGHYPTKNFQFGPNALDPVLVELLATASFLTRSPKIIELEAAIKTELETLA